MYRIEPAPDSAEQAQATARYQPQPALTSSRQNPPDLVIDATQQLLQRTDLGTGAARASGRRQRASGARLTSREWEMPLAAAWWANSGRSSGPGALRLAAGISHARGLTQATTRAGNTRGLPTRGASASPSIPCPQYRRRHLRAVSSQMPSRSAIAGSPCLPQRAAQSVIAAPGETALRRAGTGIPAQRAQQFARGVGPARRLVLWRPRARAAARFRSRDR